MQPRPTCSHARRAATPDVPSTNDQATALTLLCGPAAVGLGYWSGHGRCPNYPTVSGKVTLDTGWKRRVRALGPFDVQIAAPAAVVFDVIAEPYLGRAPRAMADKLRVVERGNDMVLAEHYTPRTAVGSLKRRWRRWRSRGPIA